MSYAKITATKCFKLQNLFFCYLLRPWFIWLTHKIYVNVYKKVLISNYGDAIRSRINFVISLNKPEHDRLLLIINKISVTTITWRMFLKNELKADIYFFLLSSLNVYVINPKRIHMIHDNIANIVKSEHNSNSNYFYMLL